MISLKYVGKIFSSYDVIEALFLCSLFPRKNFVSLLFPRIDIFPYLLCVVLWCVEAFFLTAIEIIPCNKLTYFTAVLFWCVFLCFVWVCAFSFFIFHFSFRAGGQTCGVPSRVHRRPLGASRGAGWCKTPHRGFTGDFWFTQLIWLFLTTKYILLCRSLNTKQNVYMYTNDCDKITIHHKTNTAAEPATQVFQVLSCSDMMSFRAVRENRTFRTWRRK